MAVILLDSDTFQILFPLAVKEEKERSIMATITLLCIRVNPIGWEFNWTNNLPVLNPLLIT